MTQKETEKKLFDFLRKEKIIEGKTVIINETLVDAFGSGIYDYELEEREDGGEGDGAGGGDDQMEETGKVKTRTENTVLYHRLLRNDLLTLLGRSLQDCYRITDTTTKKSTVKQGACPKVTVIAEKVKNRFVTKVLGLEFFGITPDSLVSTYSNRFACSVTTHDLPGKNNKNKVKELLFCCFL